MCLNFKMVLKFFFTVLILGFLVLKSAKCQIIEEKEDVQLGTMGYIHGRVYKTYNGNKMAQFIGIPYASSFKRFSPASIRTLLYTHEIDTIQHPCIQVFCNKFILMFTNLFGPDSTCFIKYCY